MKKHHIINGKKAYSLYAIVPKQYLAKKHKDIFPKPLIKGKTRRYYTTEQAEQILQIVAQQKKKKGVSARQMSIRVGLSTLAFGSHIKYGNLPKCPPTGYTTDQVKEVLRYFAKKQKYKNMTVGLRELGATEQEIFWTKTHKELFPQPAWQTKGQKGKHYTTKQLQKLLSTVRKLRNN
jgi:hypothetical protein